MTLFAVRELHEALRVTPRRQKGLEKAPQIGAFGASYLGPCFLHQIPKMHPGGLSTSFRHSPGGPEPQNGINFEPISSFQAARKPYISSLQPQSQVEPQNATEATAASTGTAHASPGVAESIMTSDDQIIRC